MTRTTDIDCVCECASTSLVGYAKTARSLLIRRKNTIERSLYQTMQNPLIGGRPYEHTHTHTTFGWRRIRAGRVTESEREKGGCALTDAQSRCTNVSPAPAKPTMMTTSDDRTTPVEVDKNRRLRTEIRTVG